jgi:hypothetical protein
MSRERRRERRWTVHRKFEPNRLSQATLERAYTTIVPQYILVLRAPTDKFDEPYEFCIQSMARCAK